MNSSDTATMIEVDGVLRSRFNNKGQPIHSTEDGVRNFWRWFGDSKSINHQGFPIVFYHGTQSDFSMFNIEKLGTIGQTQGAGFYFTKNADIASGYSRLLAGSNAVMPVYLKLDNPYQWGIINKRVNDFARGQSYDDLKVSVRRELGYSFKGKNEDVAPDDPILNDIAHAITNVLKRRKFDGVIAKPFMGIDLEYTVFDPRQIKSAIGNSGTFSPDSNDIADADLSYYLEDEESLRMF